MIQCSAAYRVANTFASKIISKTEKFHFTEGRSWKKGKLDTCLTHEVLKLLPPAIRKKCPRSELFSPNAGKYGPE